MRPDRCPFCRDDRPELASFELDDLGGFAQVRCHACGAAGPNCNAKTRREAVEAACGAWNAASKATREEATRAE